MTQSIQFVSRWNFKKIINKHGLRADTAYISINDSRMEREQVEAELATHQHDEARYCLFQFKDVDREAMGGITEQDAQALLTFIKDNAERNFLVHCFLGISRSAAVACFINDYLDVGNPHLARYTLYNRLVYDKLMGAAGHSLLAHYTAQEERPSD